MPVILATQEAEIRRIEIQSQPTQIVPEILILEKKKHHKNGLVEWINIVGPEFKPQYQTHTYKIGSHKLFGQGGLKQ
jgi:hypothetical protein